LQRQFPRASGYPEDPATGVAAAALAVSLYQHQQQQQNVWPTTTSFRFHQGTAMGKPSMILVENLKLIDGSGVIDTDTDTAAAAAAEYKVEEHGETNNNEAQCEETVDGGNSVATAMPQHANPKKRSKVSFTLVGRVEVDHREFIEVEDDDE
jgi:hypothetical protein